MAGHRRCPLRARSRRRAPGASGTRSRRQKLAVAVLAAFVLGGLSSTLFRRGPAEDLAPPAVKRFVAATGYIADGFGANLDISRDGTMLVHSWIEDDVRRLYLRRLDALEATELPGTEGGVHPRFSPDGRQIAFHAEGRIKKLLVAGGLSRTFE